MNYREVKASEADYQAHKQEVDFDSEDPTIYLKEIPPISEGEIKEMAEYAIPLTEPHDDEDKILTDNQRYWFETGAKAVINLINKDR